jgi:dCMP deaminase
MGWNGTPSGFPNACEDENNITIPDVIHAEINLYAKLARSSDSAKGSTLYVTLSPCVPCTLFTIQAEVARVVYYEQYRVIDGLEKLKNKGIQVCHLEY